MEKYSSVFLQEFYSGKLALPCHTLLGVPACLTKFPKLVWTIAYSIRKESCKKFQPFSFYKFESKNGRCPVTPLRVTQNRWKQFWKFYWSWATRCWENFGIYQTLIFAKNCCGSATPLRVTQHRWKKILKILNSYWS